MLLLLVASVTITGANKTTPKFPTILVFGDSTVDTGNNNYIPTPFKGDHPPYGLNFPGRAATGRFSNGKLVPDILASLIGPKETIPPFLAPNLSDEDIITGVSFASAGSGYDELTTSFSHVISMSKQPGYLRYYVKRLEGIVGIEEASRILGRALVIVSAGTNDFIFNFYDIPTRRIQFGVNEYQDFLQIKLQNFVKELYYLGCRKMVVTGLPPIGCLPIQLTSKSPILRTCIHKENADARSYNAKLERLLPRIEAELTGSKILYVDAYNPLMDMIVNPQNYEFMETRRGCCGTGLVEAGPLCTRLTPICADPSRYVFWDSIHPGESTYRIVSKALVELISKSPQFVNE
ncbi:GDSL esterase/lipase at1g06990 [Phtheirospermum japonicum]|uniref:GDSL esterase/lipase at1g06990 n=1 Tax=Phtheirospermum japonicum TaxID=374723 RepID=A0A830CU38_9LAMI|nr:GDSL esterase/lipase at1g06990 [Phtheirospermum japonicum]